MSSLFRNYFLDFSLDELSNDIDMFVNGNDLSPPEDLLNGTLVLAKFPQDERCVMYMII